MVNGECALNLKTTTLSRFQHIVIVAALIAPLLSFVSAPAQAVAPTCAEGGVCAVGDVGPGGGIVFYVSPSANGFFSAAPACTPRCKYLEAAPTTGSSAWTEMFYRWSGNTTDSIGSTGTAIGSGYSNTLAMVAQSSTSERAGTVTRDYRGPANLTDWFLPSKNELGELASKEAIVGGFQAFFYWSSSEYYPFDPRNFAWIKRFDNNATGTFDFTDKSGAVYVRPIRAFGSAPPEVISIAAIGGVAAPVTGATPVTTVTSANGYTGTVSWSGSPTTFAGATTYTATITLTAAAGYTLTGVSANFFRVAGATPVTHSADSGVITAVFPATAAVVSVAAIGGVTAPVRGATPVTTVTSGNGYTGTVSWASSTGALVGNFRGATVYTATITLTATAGYTLTGVSANFFTVSGTSAPATNPINSGVISAAFPATAVGPATKALMTTQPSGAVNGSAFTTQPVVRVTDVDGNTNTSFTGNVVASIATGTGTLGGTTTVAAVSGVATFTNLVITGTLGNFTLRFTPASLTAVDSSSFALEAPPAAAKIAITRAAVGTQRRTAFTTQPQVTIQFSNNETVTASSAVVTASISSGGTLIGTTTATASSGVATFSNLGVDGTVGTTYTISYTALDLPIASATVTLTGTTCDGATFTCQVGDTGPGGGKIFYVAPTTFTQLSAYGSMCKTWCKYLEAAPSSWFEGGEPTRSWATDVNNNRATTVPAPGALQTAIGTGYQNSNAIAAQTGNVYATSAAVVTRTYRGNGLADWYLPSKDELNQLYLQKTAVGGVWAAVYWSSTESNANAAWTQNFGIGDPAAVSKDTNFYVRPVRAFGVAPTTISIANVVIPAPVLGATPVNSITSNGQYTTAITWSGSPTTFAASTAYTATVTVTPVAGYTLSGVGSGFFTVNGSAANGVINSTNIATTGVAPYAVAADGQGNIYLANKSANNVTKITPIGVTSILGTTGTSPFAISVDSDGNVYTANQGSENVTKLTAQGVSTVLMLTGNNPKSILVDAAGSVYTANSGASNDVTKKTAQGNQTKINVEGSSPSGITIDAAGNIYTSNIVSNNVTKTTPQEVSTIFGSTGLQPYAITIDSAGNIYTANYSSNNVTKITPQGVSSILGTTSGGPNAIAIDAAGNIYTANYSSNNVTKITPQGVSSTYGTTSNYPTGITVDSEGNIYTANYGSSNVTRFSGTNTGVFTYQFPSTAAASAPVVYVAPTPVPYLKTLTTPKLNLKDGKLMCTPGTYNAGYTLDGVIQGSTTTLFTPSSFTYNLLINGITQTSLAVTSSSTSHSWAMPTTSGALITCSVTVTANGLTNTDKSGDNTSGASSALTKQSAAIATANATYSAALSANTKAYQKALVDNRTQWRSTTEKIRTDYYAERNRINSLPSTKATRALSSAALKAYTAAVKKSAADYKASGPAALAAKDVADKAALDAKTTAIAKANAAYGTAIESIGYGVLIP
jgi:hypothetical protein